MIARHEILVILFGQQIIEIRRASVYTSYFSGIKFYIKINIYSFKALEIIAEWI